MSLFCFEIKTNCILFLLFKIFYFKFVLLLNSKKGTMKYYNLNGTLIVDLAGGVAIQCTIEKIEVENRFFHRLIANFYYLKAKKTETSTADLQIIPLSKQQAVNQYMRFKEAESLYRIACEIWWRSKQKRTEAQILSDVFISMVERELNIPYPVKVEQYFWRKTHFAFALS